LRLLSLLLLVAACSRSGQVIIDPTGRNPVAIGIGIGAFVAGFIVGSWYYFDWTTTGDAEDTGLKGASDGP
jgi:hypothetical protein